MADEPAAFRRRMVLSVCLAIAINEIAIGLLHTAPPEAEPDAKATRITMERRAVPTPSPAPRPTPRATPRPTPTPRPQTPVPRVTIAAVAQHAAPKAILPKRQHAGGAPARRAKVTAYHKYAANPNGSHGAGAGIAGAGAGTGAGAGNAAGGGGGRGNGTGGTGTGAVNADAPCNDWYLNVHGGARADRATGAMHETVSIDIRTIGGSHVSETFPYDYVYPSDDADPWSLKYVKLPDGDPRVPEARIQFPPPGFDRSTLPPIIKLVLAKSTPDGLTTLPECPGGDVGSQTR